MLEGQQRATYGGGRKWEQGLGGAVVAEVVPHATAFRKVIKGVLGWITLILNEIHVIQQGCEGLIVSFLGTRFLNRTQVMLACFCLYAVLST